MCVYTQRQRERTASYEINDNKAYFKDQCMYLNIGIAGTVSYGKGNFK